MYLNNFKNVFISNVQLYLIINLKIKNVKIRHDNITHRSIEQMGPNCSSICKYANQNEKYINAKQT